MIESACVDIEKANENLVQAIKQARTSRYLTYGDIASATGLSEKVVAFAERRPVMLCFPLLTKVTEHLGLNMIFCALGAHDE